MKNADLKIITWHSCKKLGMPYPGDGEGGHWRCLAKSGGKWFIWDDTRDPAEGNERYLVCETDSFFARNVL